MKIKKLQFSSLALFISAIVLSFGYFLLNKPIGNLHSLATTFDNSIPLIPYFSVPYLLFLPLFWLVFTYAFIKGLKFQQLALTTIFVTVVSYLFYYFYQTVVFRPDTITTGFGSDLIRLIYRSDKPYNDFPSLHTSLALVFGMYVYKIKSRWSIVANIFIILVILSTLFTKQHYIADVLAGLGLALVSNFTANRIVKSSTETNL